MVGQWQLHSEPVLSVVKVPPRLLHTDTYIWPAQPTDDNTISTLPPSFAVTATLKCGYVTITIILVTITVIVVIAVVMCMGQ